MAPPVSTRRLTSEPSATLRSSHYFPDVAVRSSPAQRVHSPLSAIGDTCHIVPVLRTMQQVWPATGLRGSSQDRVPLMS